MQSSTEINIRELVLAELSNKKAQDVRIFEGLAIADCVVVASGTSSRHVAMLAEHISSEIKHKTSTNVFLDGARNSNWAVLDTGNLIVHIFHPEARSYYSLDEFFASRAN